MAAAGGAAQPRSSGLSSEVPAYQTQQLDSAEERTTSDPRTPPSRTERWSGQHFQTPASASALYQLCCYLKKHTHTH